MLTQDRMPCSTTCPDCGTFLAPPCVCPGCGLGIPADIDPDWCRWRCIITPEDSLQENDTLWRTKPKHKDEILPFDETGG